MATLPQVPEPYTWTCQECGQPIDVWDRELTAQTYVDVQQAEWPRALCLDHTVALVPSHMRESARWIGEYNRQVRQWVGQPPGTLLTWIESMPDRNGRTRASFPAMIFAVLVDRWKDEWPQIAVPYRDAVLVVLGGLVTSNWDIGAVWRFCWSWQQPDRPGTCDLWPPDAQLPRDKERAFLEARGAFFPFSERRGRKEGSTSWARDHFLEEAPLREAQFWDLFGRRPTDSELAAKMGISNPTFNRYKRLFDYKRR